jgi:hypothetical protein
MRNKTQIFASIAIAAFIATGAAVSVTAWASALKVHPHVTKCGSSCGGDGCGAGCSCSNLGGNSPCATDVLLAPGN